MVDRRVDARWIPQRLFFKVVKMAAVDARLGAEEVAESPDQRDIRKHVGLVADRSAQGRQV